jgi:hypothetical protein
MVSANEPHGERRAGHQVEALALLMAPAEEPLDRPWSRRDSDPL